MFRVTTMHNPDALDTQLEYRRFLMRKRRRTLLSRGFGSFIRYLRVIELLVFARPGRHLSCVCRHDGAAQRAQVVVSNTSCCFWLVDHAETRLVNSGSQYPTLKFAPQWLEGMTAYTDLSGTRAHIISIHRVLHLPARKFPAYSPGPAQEDRESVVAI